MKPYVYEAAPPLLGSGSESMTLLLTTSQQQMTIEIHVFSRITEVDSKRGHWDDSGGSLRVANKMGVAPRMSVF
jgi:hypothetical protein